jgi:hypothetical protein
MSGRVFLQVFPIVGDPGQAVGLNVFQGVGQGHISVTVMVAVGFPVGGDMD